MWVRGRARLLAAAMVATGLVIGTMVGDGHAGADRPGGTDRADRTDPVMDGGNRDAKDARVGTDAAGSNPGEPSGARPEPTAPEPVGVAEPVDALLGYAGSVRTQRLSYPGADYVKVHFEKLAVLPGDRVTVADPQRTEVHSYRADPTGKLLADLPIAYDESGGFWAMSVTGDTAVVTLESARREADLGAVTGLMTRYGVTIDKVTRGFVPSDDPPPAAPGGEESTCGDDDSEDAVCYESEYPTEYARSRPVARLLINGRSLCTAWRIGPNNRMLTNNHCLRDSAAAQNTEVWFDYQCVACGDRRVTTPVKVTGAEVLATNRNLDFTLFTVGGFTRIKKFGYLLLDNRQVDAGEEVYIPQHPGGDPKQISLYSDEDDGGDCVIDEPSYPGYSDGSDASYYCDTRAGSSGSPVLSRTTHRVIALHHFGGCPNSGVRADLIHEAIGDQI
ncbi:MAG: trypsin-like serine peptidase [Micromonosporaceae bacterium]